jgi:hypothetical protein
VHKPKFVSALGLFNVAVFVLATLFLPSAGTFYYDNPLSYYVNSRTDWYMAFGVLLASLLISWGVYLVVDSFQHPPKCKESTGLHQDYPGKAQKGN